MDPNDQSSGQTNPSINLPAHQKSVIQPLNSGEATNNPAIDLIRGKLNRLFTDEPDAQAEEKEVENKAVRSKHQQYMYDLSQSGKSLAQIQTDWHNYYVGLPEHEKHEVWQEFYAAHAQSKALNVQTDKAVIEQSQPQPLFSKDPAKVESKPETTNESVISSKQPDQAKSKTVAEIKTQILGKVQTRSKITRKQHLQSLVFGVATGSIVIVIMLFGLFNERFIAPFMTPSRNITSDSIILDPSNTAVGPKPEIIIPKINVQIPIVDDVPTIDEPSVEVGLQRGVVHYATTPLPGQLGNGVLFGHSANNILNKGQYKFAFVLLHKLEIGDTFYINYNSVQYAYKVFDRKIVPPSDVSVLNTTSQPSTFTLITCDPPGTSVNRLIVVGQQISPNPSANGASTVNQNVANKPAELPSNSPTLWGRFWKWVSN